MSKPVLVLVPGAWHTPESFELIIPKLESHGYTVLTRQLPSVGTNPPPKDLNDDIAALREITTKAIGGGKDVVVVPHSWSGIVAGSGLGGFGKKQREAKGEKGGVTRLAYLCGFLVPEGVSLMDAIQHQIPDWWQVKEPLTLVDPDRTDVFYNDLPPTEQQKWMKKLQSHSFATKNSKSTGAAWTEIPLSYLMCEDDNAIPIFAQEAMTGGVKAAGIDIHTERIKASHSPFLSQPDRVVEFIRRAAGENI